MKKLLSAMALTALAIGPAQANDLYRCETGALPQGEYVVFFETGKTSIDKKGMAELKKAADRAKYMLDVCVVGQADNQGDKEFNKKLAKKRATAVVAELKRLGVPGSTLVTLVQGKPSAIFFRKRLTRKRAPKAAA